VREARSLYRSAFEAGKVFGRRQTFWDALGRALRSRDENNHPVVGGGGGWGRGEEWEGGANKNKKTNDPPPAASLPCPPQMLIVQLVLTAVVNFSMGALGSVFIFAASLPGLVASYRASFLSAALFALLALLAAASVAAAFIAALAASGAAASYSVVSLAGGRLLADGAGGGPRLDPYRLPPRRRPDAPLRPHRE